MTQNYRAYGVKLGQPVTEGVFFMPFTDSTFRVSNISSLIRKVSFEKNLSSICDNHKVNRFECRKLIHKLQGYHYETFQHSLNVSYYSHQLAKTIELSEEEVFQISLGALFHDLGKILIARSVLNKPGLLSKEEWNFIKKHPQFGVDLLGKYEWANNILPFVLYHHERVDGSGYMGLKREQIPLGAKIICLADSLDAMLSNRPYCKGHNYKKSLEELEQNSGSQFEPDLVPYVIEILEGLRMQSIR
jgi:putative nucleotidyltransferase with HDIG domain